MLIVVEGMDCCGKDSVIAKLITTLRDAGHEVVMAREPSDHSEHCRDIRHTLEFGGDLTDLHRHRLLMSSRDCLMREVVSPALRKKDKLVVCSRSFLTTLAYQTDLCFDEVFNENKKLLHHYDAVPDIIVYLDIDHETYLSRLGNRGDEISSLESWITQKENFETARDRYLDIMYDKSLFRSLGGNKDIKLMFLDGTRPIDESVDMIAKHIG